MGGLGKDFLVLSLLKEHEISNFQGCRGNAPHWPKKRRRVQTLVSLSILVGFDPSGSGLCSGPWGCLY